MCCAATVPLVPPKPLTFFVAKVGVRMALQPVAFHLLAAGAAKLVTHPALPGRRHVAGGWWPWFTQPHSSCQGSGVPWHVIIQDHAFILTLRMATMPKCKPGEASQGAGMPLPLPVALAKREGAAAEQQGSRSGTLTPPQQDTPWWHLQCVSRLSPRLGGR